MVKCVCEARPPYAAAAALSPPECRPGRAENVRRGSTIGGLVSTLVIRLLGRPGIERDGGVMVPPRGHKAWAVLAYLALAERPVADPPLESLLSACLCGRRIPPVIDRAAATVAVIPTQGGDPCEP